MARQNKFDSRAGPTVFRYPANMTSIADKIKVDAVFKHDRAGYCYITRITAKTIKYRHCKETRTEIHRMADDQTQYSVILSKDDSRREHVMHITSLWPGQFSDLDDVEYALDTPMTDWLDHGR